MLYSRLFALRVDLEPVAFSHGDYRDIYRIVVDSGDKSVSGCPEFNSITVGHAGKGGGRHAGILQPLRQL